nr:formin-1-like [Rhipicephalus microplus]
MTWTFSDLIQKMGKKRLSLPDTVFYDIDSEEETTEKARPLQFMQPSLHASPPSPPLPSPPPLWPCSPLSPQGWSATLPLPPPQHLLLPKLPSPSSEQPRMQPCPLMPPVPHPGTTSSGSQEPTSQGLGASDELPLFFQVDNQIHLGNGIFLEQENGHGCFCVRETACSVRRRQSFFGV